MGTNPSEFSSASLLPCCVINHNMIIVKVCFFFTVFLVLDNAVALPSHFFRGKQIPNLPAGEQTAITLCVLRNGRSLQG